LVLKDSEELSLIPENDFSINKNHSNDSLPVRRRPNCICIDRFDNHE
jgi:hypothetical protein